MAKWNIRTFTTSGGGKPFDEWILAADPVAQAEIVLTIDLLEEHGTDLGMPHARHLENGIWELRARSGNNIYRVLYFHWKGRTFGLLHGFTKKTQRTPKGEIQTALNRRAEWLARPVAPRKEPPR